MKLKGLIVTLAILITSPQLFAAQYVDAYDDSVSTVRVSKKEMTRISIEDGYISDMQSIVGELDTKKDEKTGQLYVKPLVNKLINLFIKSERGRNYLLKLKPTKMDADSVIIREGSLIRQKEQQELRRNADKEKELARNSESYTGAIKDFVKSIATQQFDGDVSCGQFSGEEIPLWKEAFFVKVGQCSGANLQAQLFSLTNISGKEMVLDEQEFFKKGVVAVVIMEHQLMPGKKTDIYVVFGN